MGFFFFFLLFRRRGFDIKDIVHLVVVSLALAFFRRTACFPSKCWKLYMSISCVVCFACVRVCEKTVFAVVYEWCVMVYFGVVGICGD